MNKRLNKIGLALVVMMLFIAISVNGADSTDSIKPAKAYEPLTKVFDRLDKPHGWLGSDGGSSARLSDGRDAFAFSDSVIGKADKEGNMSNWSMVRNCLIITNTEGDDPDYFEDIIGVTNKLPLDDAAFINSIGKWKAENAALSLSDEYAVFGDNSMKAVAMNDEAVLIERGKGKDGFRIRKREVVTAKAMIKAEKALKVTIGVAYYDRNGSLLARHDSDEITISSEWARLNYAGPKSPDETVYASIFINLPEVNASDTVYIANCGAYIGDASMQSWSLPGKGWPYENLVNAEEVNLVNEDNLTGDWFWFSGAVSIGSKLYVFMNHFGENDGEPPWNFEFKNNQYIGQWDTETNTFEGVFEWSKDDPIQWGTCHLKENGYIFFIGYGDRDHYLVRVPDDNLFGQKEYWTGEDWSTDREKADVIANLKFWGGNIDGICKINDKYIAVYIESFGKSIKLLEADSITGPWVDTNKAIYTAADLGEGSYAYIPRIHNQFTSSEDGIVMSYSTSTDDGKLATYKFVKSSFANHTETPTEANPETPTDTNPETPTDTNPETPIETESEANPDTQPKNHDETDSASDDLPDAPNTGDGDIWYLALIVLLLPIALITYKACVRIYAKRMR